MIRKSRSRKRSVVQPPRYMGPAVATAPLHITWARVASDNPNVFTLVDAHIHPFSIVLVTLESNAAQTGTITLAAPPSEGSVDLLFTGQDGPPFIHYAVFNP